MLIMKTVKMEDWKGGRMEEGKDGRGKNVGLKRGYQIELVYAMAWIQFLQITQCMFNLE